MKNLFLLAFTMLLTLVAVDADAQTLYGYTRDYPYAMVKIDVTNTAAATRTGSVDVLATAGAFVNDTYYVIGMDDDFNTLVYTGDMAYRCRVGHNQCQTLAFYLLRIV